MPKYTFVNQSFSQGYEYCVEVGRTREGKIVVLGKGGTHAKDKTMIFDPEDLIEMKKKSPAFCIEVGMILPVNFDQHGPFRGGSYLRKIMAMGGGARNQMMLSMGFDAHYGCGFRDEVRIYYPVVDDHGFAPGDLVLVTYEDERYTTVVKRIVPYEKAKPFLDTPSMQCNVSKLIAGECVSPEDNREKRRAAYKDAVCVRQTPEGLLVVGSYLGSNGAGRVIYESFDGGVYTDPSDDADVEICTDFKIQNTGKISVIELEEISPTTPGKTPKIVRRIADYKTAARIKNYVDCSVFFLSELTGMWKIKSVNDESIKACSGLHLFPDPKKLRVVHDTRVISSQSNK